MPMLPNPLGARSCGAHPGSGRGEGRGSEGHGLRCMARLHKRLGGLRGARHGPVRPGGPHPLRFMTQNEPAAALHASSPHCTPSGLP